MFVQKFWLFIFFLFIPTISATNGMFPVFMGIPAGGRGGVDIGIASDPTCINTNPGGLGFLHGKTIEISAGGYFPSISFDNSVNHSSSDFEPIPFGSFALAWDHFNQTGEVFLDPWVYLFGGQPRDSEYIFISGDEPMSGTLPSGTSYLDVDVNKDFATSHLQVQGSKGTLEGLRIGIWKTQQDNNRILSTSSLPSLPPQSHIVGVSVHFEWRLSTNATQSQDGKLVNITIVADAQSSHAPLVLQNSEPTWQKGYIALAWDKAYPPAFIQILVDSASVDVQLKEVSIGYRLIGQTYWKPILLENISLEDVPEIVAWDTLQYTWENNQITRIQMAPFLANGKMNTHTKVRLYYHFQMESTSSPYANVSLMNGENVLIRKKHGGTVRESSHPVAVSHRQSDHDVPMHSRSSGWKFGLGVFPQAGAKYSINIKSDDFFQDGVDSRTDMTFISIIPSLAYRFGDRLSIGVSLNLNWEMIELDGLVSQTSMILQGKPIDGTSATFGDYLVGIRNIHNIKGEMDTDTLWGFGLGGRIGLLWKITERIQFGAMYSPKTWMMDASGKVVLDFNRHFQQIDIATIAASVLPNRGRNGFSGKYDMKLDFDLPQQAGIGLSWLLANNFLVSADVRWVDYSDTQYSIKARVSNGSNPDLNALIGNSRTTAKIAMGWKDQYIAGVGFVWQTSSRWIWRMGYNYSSNPVPEEYLNPQLAAIAEHHVTLGASYVVSRYITLHTAVEAGLPSRLKSGDVNYVHEKYANSELEMFTVAGFMGLSMRF